MECEKNENKQKEAVCRRFTKHGHPNLIGSTSPRFGPAIAQWVKLWPSEYKNRPSIPYTLSPNAFVSYRFFFCNIQMINSTLIFY